MRPDSLTAIQRLKSRVSENYRRARERDNAWILRLDVDLLNKVIWPLFVGYICLNFLDVYTTTLAMNFGPLFHEENPIAAPLFNGQLRNFVMALTLKYLPAIPLFYIVFAGDKVGRHQVEIRTVKFSALIALVGADLLLFYIVGVHNITVLMNLHL